LNEHFGSQGLKFHQLAGQRAKDFCDVTTNRIVSIDLQANARIARRASRKPAYIYCSYSNFCGHQIIALRGHWDDWSFHALLQFHVDAGDYTLKQNLETAAHNAIYTTAKVYKIRFVEN